MYLPYGTVVALAIIILDQISKWWLMSQYQLPLHAPVELLPFLNLVVVFNHGISFGMLSDVGLSNANILIIITSFITAFLFGWLKKADHVFLARALGLVIGGAIGNIIDRFRFGAVFDFVDVHAMGYHWPAFNVADASICIGVFLLLIDGLCKKDPSLDS